MRGLKGAQRAIEGDEWQQAVVMARMVISIVASVALFATMPFIAACALSSHV